jgi:hypothetical protein
MSSFRQARGAGSSLEAGMMSTFELGQMLVRRSGYGAMQLAGPYAFGPPPDRASAIGVLRAAVAAGVDHIDTAQYYGPGVVNDLIREALHPYPGGLAIVSKVAVRRDDDGAVLPFDDPDQLCEGIENNLRSLPAGQLAALTSACPATGAWMRVSMTGWPPWWRLATRTSSPGLASAMPGEPRAHQPGSHRDGRPPRYHASAGRTPVASATGPQCAPHPWDGICRSPAGEPGRRRHRAR